MTPREILDALNPNRFEPFVVLTNSGDRYEVRHPEMARLVETGSLYVFLRSPSADPADPLRVVKLSLVNIAALEEAEIKFHA